MCFLPFSQKLKCLFYALTPSYNIVHLYKYPIFFLVNKQYLDLITYFTLGNNPSNIKCSKEKTKNNNNNKKNDSENKNRVPEVVSKYLCNIHKLENILYRHDITANTVQYIFYLVQ